MDWFMQYTTGFEEIERCIGFFDKLSTISESTLRYIFNELQDHIIEKYRKV